MSEMMITVIEVDMNTPEMQDYIQYPAISNWGPSGNVYFIKDNRIVGKGCISSEYGGNVNVYPTDAAALEFFEDFEEVKLLGNHAPMRFHKIMGDADPNFPDLPVERFDGITIVSCFDFDFGLHSRMRYGHIEGFGMKRSNK